MTDDPEQGLASKMMEPDDFILYPCPRPSEKEMEAVYAYIQFSSRKIAREIDSLFLEYQGRG